MNILVAVDRQPESADAVATAKAFFGDDHHYIFLSIADFVTSASAMGLGIQRDIVGLADKVKEDAHDNAAGAAREQAGVSGFPNSEVAVEVGAVGPTICQHAVESQADVIVMGSRKHSIWDRIFDPSAGRYVIDHAPCPVLVVR